METLYFSIAYYCDTQAISLGSVKIILWNLTSKLSWKFTISGMGKYGLH